MNIPVANASEPGDKFLFTRGAAWFAYGMTIALMVIDYVDRQVIVSMFPYLKAEWSLSDKELGLLVSVISVTVAVFGTPVAWIADRVSKPLLMASCMVVGAVAIAFLASGDDLVSLWTFTLLVTFVEAIFPVSWATVGDFFGRRSFATIRGTMSFFYLWGPALGPVLAGAVYDRHQSYAPLMPAYLVTFLVAGVLYALLRKPGSS